MERTVSWQSMQDAAHDGAFAYEKSSPHLLHASLYALVVGHVRAEVQRIFERENQCHALDIGAGHGHFTDELAIAGARVVASEMSSASVAHLEDRYRHNSQISVIHDPDGEKAFTQHSAFDLVTCVSVLHHIPDYIDFIRRITSVIRPGGSLIAFQDPLFYPRLPAVDRITERSGYFVWRLGQGDLRQGLATRIRRLKGRLDESNPADMVEYHVVRQGVDERAIVEALDGTFAGVNLVEYWSTYIPVLQKLGERLRLRSHFGVIGSTKLDP